MKIKNYLEVVAEPLSGAKGVNIRWLWSKSDGAPNFAMRLIEVEQGASTPNHTHPYEHEVYVLNGKGMVRTIQRNQMVAAGDTVMVFPDEKHQFVNLGSDTLRFLCAIPLPEQTV